VSSIFTKAAKSDFGAGIAIALLSLTYALSYGALLFSSPDLSPYISYTIAASLITTIVTVLVVSLMSGIRFSVAGPDSNTVAVLASFIVVFSQSATQTGLTGKELALFSLTGLCLATLLTALTMFLMGRFKLGNIVRFVPISVAGGFLAAAGCLMINGAFYLATGQTIPELITSELSDLQGIKLAGLVGFALFFWALTRLSASQMALPSGIFFSIFVIHCVLTYQNISLSQAQDMGLLLDGGGESSIFFPPLHGIFTTQLWISFFNFLPELIVTVTVTALSILLIIAGIEIDKSIDGDLNHELKIHGYAIGLSGLLGGFIGLVSLSRSLLNAGKRSRFPVAAVMTCLLCGVVLLVGGSIISLLPKMALAAMILLLGTQIAYRWLGETYSMLDRNEYILLLLISSTTLYAGFISGLVLGVVCGCILFAARASFVSVVRQEMSGEGYRSRIVRSADEETYLSNLNQSIRIYELQGFLFFGTAHNFYTKIKNDLQDKSSPIRHVILSFKHVSGVDASAEQILQKIFLAADKQNASISTIELPMKEQTTIARLLRRSPTLIADQNYAAIYDAMEAIEENLLREREFEGSRVSLQGWLETRLGEAGMAEKLFECLDRVDYKSGDIICSQGDEANDIFFLDFGRVDVVSYDVPEQPFRIYSFMRHTMLGEMGFVRKETRSAELVARGATSVYGLSRETYDKLEAANDPVIDTLLQLISVTLSDRIISANRTIAELQA
tara:strand:- start:3024 stop:5216 length:2193 start_codon:yes stop_codon:yes gene_type:complete